MYLIYSNTLAQALKMGGADGKTEEGKDGW